MHKNPLWIVLLTAVALTVLWFTGSAAYKYYRYQSFNASTYTKQVIWTTFHKSSDIYLIQADYTFVEEGNEFKGSTIFSEPVFRNPWAAEDAIKQYSQVAWPVWFSKKTPSYSSLEHKMPWKEIFSAGILWVLLAYFIGLGYYVARYQRKTQ